MGVLAARDNKLFTRGAVAAAKSPTFLQCALGLRAPLAWLLTSLYFFSSTLHFFYHTFSFFLSACRTPSQWVYSSNPPPSSPRPCLRFRDRVKTPGTAVYPRRGARHADPETPEMRSGIPRRQSGFGGHRAWGSRTLLVSAAVTAVGEAGPRSGVSCAAAALTPRPPACLRHSPTAWQG